MAHVFVTGHTGFKGAWLVVLLRSMGHEVSGYALAPQGGNLFTRAGLSSELTFDLRGDIRDFPALQNAIKNSGASHFIHLAAQPLVSEGIRNPAETYEVNVLGTLNFLRATDDLSEAQNRLVVTTDKVYAPSKHRKPFVEDDWIGGTDPYSTSKAAADVIAQEWMGRVKSTRGTIARAGNVVGFGDYAANRLLPDLVRAARGHFPLRVRNPESVRPWQHVLDCLNGYIRLLFDDSQNPGSAWNFGPLSGQEITVGQVVSLASTMVPNLMIEVIPENQSLFDEQVALMLDSGKANERLSWWPVLSVEESLRMALAEVLTEGSARSIMMSHVQRFLERLQPSLSTPPIGKELA